MEKQEIDHTNAMNFPKLGENSNIKKDCDEIACKKATLNIRERRFQKRITNIQKNCPHENTQKVMEFDKSYHWGVYGSDRGMNVFQGKKCLDCGHFEPRPKGHPWDICHRCGDKMKDLGRAPGQGGDGGHYYQCSNPKCGHEVMHT